ncbi:MAG: hypothetical protein IJU40_05315, partial [Desulfovibrionaceae bacterium]|nr:hypothetical protein [Desulfovibrionaceae bacterium]
GRGASRVNTGEGNDVIALREDLGYNKIINGGAGYDTLDLTGQNRKAIITDSSLQIGWGKASLKGIEALVVKRGPAEIDAKNLEGELDITTSRNSDEIVIGGGETRVNAGEGDNTIVMYGKGYHSVQTGKGDDSYYLAKGSIEINDAGGDNEFAMVVNGNDAAKSIDINLGKAGKNTFKVLGADFNDQDPKSWLEGLNFNLSYAPDGSSSLNLDDLGKTAINISGLEGQYGTINFYEGNHTLFKVDLASLVQALEDGGDTKGLTFIERRNRWVAQVKEEVIPAPEPVPAPEPEPTIPEIESTPLTIIGSSGNDVINFGAFGKVIANAGLGEDTYNINVNNLTHKFEAIEQGSDADQINFFGLGLEANSEKISALLNNLTFSLTQGDNQALTLTIGTIIPEKPDFSLTTMSGSFEGDKVNFYSGNLGDNQLLASLDLESIVSKLNLNQNGVNLTFTQDSENPTKFNAG